jgi:phenylalanyl-tRNA synthetase beta chain
VFAECKGVLETLHASLRSPLHAVRDEQPFLHPGRAAAAGAGFFGELHPRVAAAFGIDMPAAVFELDVAALQGLVHATPLYRDVVSFPPLRQDLAVALDEDVPAGDVVDAVYEAAGDVLARAEVFDVYRGPQVGDGRKSLALHLVFQATDRTLVDAEADAVRAAIIEYLGRRFGAEVRV